MGGNGMNGTALNGVAANGLNKRSSGSCRSLERLARGPGNYVFLYCSWYNDG
jgi:hypothetical protein